MICTCPLCLSSLAAFAHDAGVEVDWVQVFRSPKRVRLLKLIDELCLLQESVTLSSGAVSSVYFDCKRVMLNGEALSLISEVLIEEIEKLPETPTAIGGLTMGADFIVAAVIQKVFETGRPTIYGCIARKEPKNHGTRSSVENELPPGTTIVVVDDVITTGSSTIKACEEFLKQGYRIAGILALVDREQGGIKKLATKYGAPVRALFKKREFY